jgi:hypothetical protein
MAIDISTNQKAMAIFENKKLWSGIWVAVAGVLALLFLNSVGPALIGGIQSLTGIITNLFKLVIYGGLFSVLMYTGWKMRTVGALFIRAIPRALTRQIIKIDPIGIMESVQEDIGYRVNAIEVSETEMQEAINATNSEITEFQGKMADALEEARYHKKSPEGSQIEAESSLTAAAEYEKAVGQTQDKIKILERLKAGLVKLRQIARAKQKEMDAKLDIARRELKLSGIVQRAVTGALGLFADNEEIKLFNAAQMEVNSQFNHWVTNLDAVLQSQESAYASVRARRGIAVNRGQELVEEWERQIDRLSRGEEIVVPDKEVLPAQAGMPAPASSTIASLLGVKGKKEKEANK